MVDIKWNIGIAILSTLYLFGVLYNRWVAGLERDGHDRGYMGMIVSLGCFVTIGMYTLWVGSLYLGLVLLLCFMASGTPMLWGSIARYARQRRHDEEAIKRDVEETLGGLEDGRQADCRGIQRPAGVEPGSTGEQTPDRAGTAPD